MGCTMHSRVGIFAQLLWVLIGVVLSGLSIWQIFAIKNFEPPRFRKLDYADQRARFRNGTVANGALPTYLSNIKTKHAAQLEWVLIFTVVFALPRQLLGLIHRFKQLIKYPAKVPDLKGWRATIVQKIFHV